MDRFMRLSRILTGDGICRRQLLAVLAVAAIAPLAPRVSSACQPADDDIVLFDGWVLLADDLRAIAAPGV